MVAVTRKVTETASGPESAKRRQILDGARAVFLAQGFEGASMNDIAKAAGVSKGTLYVYFADKHHLFEAIVEQESLDYGRATFNFAADRDPQTMLYEFGCAYIEWLCRPQGGSAIRTVMAIAERMPDVGKGFYDRVIAKTITHVGEYLRARVKAGDLSINDADTELAAAQFMLSCQALLFQPFIFQAAPSPPRDKIERNVRSATRMFLAAYGSK